MFVRRVCAGGHRARALDREANEQAEPPAIESYTLLVPQLVLDVQFSTTSCKT
jgi:hypothetical protein